MSLLCNLNVYITVEAATLIGLTFVAASSFLVRTIMAKRKTNKAGLAKPPTAPGLAPSSSQATMHKVTDATPGSSQQAGPQSTTAPVAAPPVVREIHDKRPEKS